MAIKYYTQAGAARLLEISPNTLRTQVDLGVIKREETIDGLRLIPAAEVARYRREHLGQVGRPKKK